MKIQHFLFGAAGLLAMTSCSNDELVSVNRDGDEIAFNVVTNASGRANDVYCNNNMPTAFNVWATYDGSTYISGDDIEYQDSKWVNTSGTRYWPDGAVKFFAHVNAGNAFNWNNGAPKIEDFTVETDVANQVDLLYAVKEATKPATGGQVTLNFRHALSQIVFAAKNTNKNLYVEISGVTVCKLGNTNTFTYGTDNTDNNIENHEGTVGTITYDGSWGTWTALSGGSQNYSVDFTAVPVAGNNTAVSLTNTNITGKEFSSNAMLLLPQTTTAWNPEVNPTSQGQTGTYFLVKCQIWNVAGTTVDKDNDVCLWGKDGASDVAIPVSINWEQGKKYLYTFVFGEGNGGYNPDPDDPTPDPILVPITFNITVDDFVPGDNSDIEMK